ncbi:MAG TPA: hypothetical protein VM912_05515, partial [Terriglobales bacterium]|nr:hypothetical protein [Terriglobales bacterium]
IQYANAVYPSTTGMTMIAPMRTNSWLAGEDAASQRETLTQVRHGFSDFHDFLSVSSRKCIYLQRRILKNAM